MSIFLNEITPLKAYRGNYLFPVDKSDIQHNAIVYILSSNTSSSLNLLQTATTNPNTKLNATYFQSYFIEKAIELIIDNKLHENGTTININGEEYPLDEVSYYINNVDDVLLEDNDIAIFNDRIYFPDMVDTLLESKESNINTALRTILYKERFKNQSQLLAYYNIVKETLPFIKYTFSEPRLYKNKNVFYDWSYYTEMLVKNSNKYNAKKFYDLFIEFMKRFLCDKRFNNYRVKTIIIPVNDWIQSPLDIVVGKTNNMISLMLNNIKYDIYSENLKDFNFIFMTNNNIFFRLDFSTYNSEKDFVKVIGLLKKLISSSPLTAAEYEDVSKKDSKEVILHKVVDSLNNAKMKFTNLSGDSKTFSSENIKVMNLVKSADSIKDTDLKKAVLVNKLKDTIEKVDKEEEVMDALEQEQDKEKTAQLLMDIQSEEAIGMNKARQERHDKTQKELLTKTVRNKTIKELLDHFETNNNIPETSIEIDSIDDHWKHLTYANFNSMYTKEDMDADIVAMFTHFTKISHPLNLLNINTENTSTSEDYKNTWTVGYEDAESGKRFTIKVDLPIMVDNRFMKLRGNEKTLIGQLMLLPIEKTDEDTVQIVSNYNKIFVRRKSPSGDFKSNETVNKLNKILSKYSHHDMKITFSDNRKVSSRYILPITFIDLSTKFNTIKFKDGSYIDFNMDRLMKTPFDREKLPQEDRKLPEDVLNNKYLAVYVNKDGFKEPPPEKDMSVENNIVYILSLYSENFVNEYNTASASKKLVYSEGSILASKIPVIVMCAYNIGLQKTLDKAGIQYEITENRPSKDCSYFKFIDGYLSYKSRSMADDMLMNGLAQVDTNMYSLTEINGKDMWLNVLDDFGGRIKADGLDNFYDLMMDPITVEICKILDIPSDYIGALLYSSNLLIDNKYIRHSDISGNRVRVNEVIIGHLYQVLSREFGTYRNMVKRNKKDAIFSVKQGAVIDSILNHDQTSSDYSTLTPLLEAETANKITFKGLSGMNSERAFNMEKRSYDESMLGVLSLSTGFAGNVGINRQTTVDAGVLNKRGFIKKTDPKKLDNLSTLSVMEALSPMAINHDDGMRTCMAFLQTTSHQMSVKKAMPNLITTGMDEALIYLTGDKFAYKFKGNKGKVIEMTNEYIIVEDIETKEKDFIDIREKIQKNSDGGFFLTTKLTPNKGIKVGSILKKNDVVAYNKKSYSPAIGNGNHNNINGLSYNIGTLAKVAIMNTDMGFEDSCVVDEYLSEALTTELCVQKEIQLSSTSNIYYMVKPGEPIQEGEPLIIFTDSFEDEDANAILRNITDDNEFLSDIGRKKIHSKVSGVVQDIKIYRTVDINKLSPTLKKVVTQYEDKINKLKKVMEKNKIDKTYTLESTQKLEAEGKLKGLDGILIEFYVKTIDQYSSGDKLVYYNGLKGVCSAIIPKADTAHSEYRPNEAVNAFLTCTGVGARMVPSALTTGLLNKAIIELTRQCQEKLGIEWRPLHVIMTTNPNNYD